MAEFELSAHAQQWVNLVLIWVGFGVVSGLLAKALVPGPDPGGLIGILLVGILGSAIGPLVMSVIIKRGDFNPISPLGLLAATAGAIVLLAGYRLLAMWLPIEAEEDI